MIDRRKSLLDRFLLYTTFNTMSDDKKVGILRPTTEGQEEMQMYLKAELEKLGLKTYYGEEKVLMGILESNSECKNTIGFMAHVDVSSDVEGNNVKAKVWENYDGKDIVLDTTIIKTSENTKLSNYIGTTIITSDGKTLLGADDKAGVAIIMEALSYLTSHKEIKHPRLEVYFTPDEETGSGMKSFPYSRLQSSVCYTVDGGEEGYVECECFNAATVKVKIKGISFHLGSARGRMVNALTIASKIISCLPESESPEATDGRFGYYCPMDLTGSVTDAEFYIFIRDFDLENFRKRIERVESLIKAFASIYHGEAQVDTTISYYNMAEANKKCPNAVKAVFESAKELNIPLEEAIIRGGTDGARLAEVSKVPSPNLFTGGSNYHSLSEWITLDGMNRSLNLVLSIISWWNNN